MNLDRIAWVVLALTAVTFARAEEKDWHRSSLQAAQPDAEVLRFRIDGKPGPIEVIERWWNGKRVRWLNESGTMRPDDLRGGQLGDVLQVDMDGDGFYDGSNDLNVKWSDSNGDGIPDVQAIVVNPDKWTEKGKNQTGHPIWMLFINHDQRGVLGWIDWSQFNFNCWDRTGTCDWLPNYHGNNDFVKTHAPAYAFKDPRLNWENPFSFYDEDGDGVSEWAIRWCAPEPFNAEVVDIPAFLDSAYLTYDLDNNSGKGNETTYDMTLKGAGAKVDISSMVHPLPHFTGDAKFDGFFYHNEWRRLKEVIYMDRDKSYDAFFSAMWTKFYFTFDEDGDDHRWERVELMYPTNNSKNDGPPVDLYSTALFNNKEGRPPGMNGHYQSDSLGDRGEFDLDGSGEGKLYVGAFDRKLHLLGAEWGAWTVDKNAEFHGGVGEPSRKPRASKVEEVVKYTDTNRDGFIDLIEYDYDGDRKIDLTVNLLDYVGEDGKGPQGRVLEPAKLGWKGLHEEFQKMAQEGWVEALMVYRAAWKRDLTDSKLDKLAAASSMMERYQNGYWIKEKIFRKIVQRLNASAEKSPQDAARFEKMKQDYVRAYYTGDFDAVVRLIAEIPTE